MELTPGDIFEDFSNKRINKSTASALLISLIENSKEKNIRLESIKILENIDLNNDNIFNLLENLIISDSNREIRNAAVNFLKNKFIDKAINPFKWVLKYETDLKCLISIIQSLIEMNTHESKTNLINEIKKIIKIKYLNKEKRVGNKFRRVLKNLLKRKKLFLLNQSELGEIIINYFIIFNLIKQYPNVFYELDTQNGLIQRLDLSDDMEYEVRGTPFGWKNNIQSIDEIFGLDYLNNLNKIDLSNNLITNVKKITRLKGLTHLILKNNKISEIDNLTYIKELPHLKFLDLRGNELGKKMNLNEFNPKIKVLLKDSDISLEK